jgi:aminopeptidase N
VTSNAQIEDFTATDEDITIAFRPPLLAGEEYSVTVAYDAEPQRGLYFRTPEMGYPPTDTHLFTQGQTHEARHWFPTSTIPTTASAPR